MDKVLEYLPEEVRKALEKLEKSRRNAVEEIRFRMGREVTILAKGQEEILSLSPILLTDESLLTRLVNRCCHYSPYALEDQLRQGFLPLAGGHRLGLCGTVVLENSRVIGLKDLSSANLRIAREYDGIATELIYKLGKSKENILFFGCPGCGKTTLLRDFVRQISDGGQRVSLVDSRGELAAVQGGKPQLDVGACTDVLTLGEKSMSMEWMLRVMNPQWIAVDEITAEKDLLAMENASYCGVGILATAHGFSISDLQQRPLYRHMMELRIFQQIVVLKPDKTFELRRITH